MAMKHLTLRLIGILVLVGAIVGLAQADAAGLQIGSGANPPSVQFVAQHLDLHSASQGRLTERTTYQTSESLSSALTWYTARYEPEARQHMPNL